ncbi:MAG: tRNA (N6-threonylcarbamoyladenosine(37)-N6)-methyltransferase TrmO [Thermodesulfobacteriota bacterium]
MKTLTLPVIGVIRTPFTSVAGIPRQASLAPDVTGRAELFPEYEPGLRDVDQYGKVWLYYGFHGVDKVELVTRSRREGREMGVFATRSPRRPSRMGVSLVEVIAVEDAAVVFKGVDMLDGSPLLDIKPWMEDSECP